MQILFAGDVMLGRLVNKVLANAQFTYVWGNTIDIIKRADFSLINLECAVSSNGKEWNKTFKVFHFRANLDAIQVLNSASIDYVSLANNHILDYDVEALLDTLDILDKNNISHSGAGRNLKEAIKPAIIEKKLKLSTSNNQNYYYNVDKKVINDDDDDNLKKNTIRIGLISLTDNEPGWEAKDDFAGINYIPITLEPDRYYYRLQNYIEEAKKQSDLVIVSSHVGPHFRETPSMKYVNFAHKIIDLGADIYWGHSNHMPQGIELYKYNNNNKIILYDCGDFIDDYAIDSNYRNDLSFIFLLHFFMDRNSKLSNDNNCNNGNILLQNSMMELIPTKITNFMVNTIPVDDNDTDIIINRMAKRCSLLGTKYL
ncbi:MAG TPA: CapA family protein [Nitrososphaeraceae archaeon]|nr:CapA family protein [Nitrososphaeraceae archaeon]